MANVVLDYKASVPSSTSGGTAHQFIPQIPSQLQVADLGMFLPELTMEAQTIVYSYLRMLELGLTQVHYLITRYSFESIVMAKKYLILQPVYKDLPHR